jgi:hypothetical protein
MTVPKFKKWLESRIQYLRGLDEIVNPDDGPYGLELLEEAYQFAIDLNLSECAKVCKPPVTIGLLECLNAIPETKTVLTPPEVAEQLGAAPETVVGWINSGQLKGANLATDHRPRYVVEPDDLTAFLKSRQPQPPATRKAKAKPSGCRRFSE